MLESQFNSALSPETWPFSLLLLPSSTCLVGGAVRNALLGRQSEYLDLDFVLPDKALKTARLIARSYKAGFVVLDAERKIARVVFKNATADFATREGLTLEADLRRRDYTINAIAYHIKTGEFIDPLGGREDLQRRLVRMVSPTNLADDPLRMLRAYRQAAQLDFAIDSETEAAIAELAPMLCEVAAERVRTEFVYILNAPQGDRWLGAAWENGLLQYWFPSATGESLARIARVDAAAAALGKNWPQLKAELARDLRDSLKISGHLFAARLACLLSPEINEAETELMRLKFSRAERRAAMRVLRSWQILASMLEQPRETTRETTREITRETTREITRETTRENRDALRSQYFLFREVEPMFPALAVLAVAEGISPKAISELCDRYLQPKDIVAHPVNMVAGNKIMAALQIPNGPEVGRLLTEIQIARCEGLISTPEEALEFARNKLKNENENQIDKIK